MPISRSRRTGALIAAFALSCLALACVARPAPAGTIGAHLRVVADGSTLADVKQFSGTSRIVASPDADCFGPGTGGSGDRTVLKGPTALGLVNYAAQSLPALRPVLVTDAFGFGLGVCGFGGHNAASDYSSFWYLKVNHRESQTAGDTRSFKRGNGVLWYLIPSSACPPPTYACVTKELEVRAPVSDPDGSFEVRVFSYSPNGVRAPVAGAEVTGAAEPTDAEGRTTVTLASSGSITATVPGNPGAIPYRTRVCIGVAEACPSARGKQIIGSRGRDRIRATDGDDVVRPRAGADRIAAWAGNDVVHAVDDHRDLIGCGAGKDEVFADPVDRVYPSCEVVKRR